MCLNTPSKVRSHPKFLPKTPTPKPSEINFLVPRHNSSTQYSWRNISTFSAFPPNLYQLDHQRIYSWNFRASLPARALYQHLRISVLRILYQTHQTLLRHSSNCNRRIHHHHLINFDVVSLQTSQGCKPNLYQFINSLRSLSNVTSANPFVSISAICRSVDTCSTPTLPYRMCSRKK